VSGHADTVVARLKEAVSHTFIYGLGSVLQTLVGFVLIPLYTRYYSPDRYGIFTLVVLVGTLAGAVFFLGGSSALSRSYYDYETADERKAVVGTSLAITLAGAALQIIVGIVFARRISLWLFATELYAPHVALSLASSAVGFVNGLLFLVLRFERRSVLVIVLNVLSLLASTGLIVGLLIVAQMDVMAPILGSLIAQSLLLIALVIACRKAFILAISSRELRPQLVFGLTAVVIGLGYYVLDSVDRFFVAKYCSLTDVGVYSLGYKMGMLIHIVFILPFSQIWAPMRMQYRNDDSSPALFRTVLTYYWILGLFATVTISTFAQEIIGVVARRPEYFGAYRVVPLVMLAHLFYGVINIIDFGIFVSRKVWFHAVLFWATLGVNAALNLLLVPRFGYIAAAWVTLVSYVGLAAAIFVAANRFYVFPVETRRVTLLLASSALALIAGALVPRTVLVVSLLERGFILMCVTAFWYLAVLTRSERRFLRPRQLLRAT
jgi:O-antigen/teichoic acid export membrane protein